MSKAPFKYLDPKAMARLGKLSLVARGVVEGYMTGLHRSPYKGFSVEFAEHRMYVPGDPLKHIDWRSFARTERLHVKQFEDETNLRCYVLLDASASMAYRGEAPSGGLLKGAKAHLGKLDYACYLAASLAYLMIHQQDPVGLVVFDRQIRQYIAPRANPEHLRVLMDALEKVKAGEKTSMAGPFHELAETIKKRALIVIVSDLYDEETELLRALRHFRHRKHEVLLLHLLDPSEVEFPFSRLSEFRDLETGERVQVDPRFVRDEYLKQLEAYCGKFKKACAEAGADYCRINTAVPYDEALGRYLALRMRA
ncbi:MAG: DUF58 domain-containing protein [Planctomycetota bacterium]|nr:DUF58 domain-containing protein [Planctomycetota bacterium]